MGELILVLGGARSGKSRFAEALAGAAGAQVVYLATGQAGDAEMQARIAHHQGSRPASWRTVEEPLALADAVQASGEADCVLVDCLTFWLTNRLFAELGEAHPACQSPGGAPVVAAAASSDTPAAVDGAPTDRATVAALEAAFEQRIAAEIERLARVAADVHARVVVVSNEVGQGLVPEYPLGRLFRDLQGRANQWLAARADQVFVTWAGIPVEIKSRAYRLEE